MMGTRSGSIDPGLVLHLLRRGDSVDRVEEVLNRESGLLGISGISSDMREIRAAIKRGDPRAQLAFDIYVHRIRFHIGGMVPVLGGLDALVFTGGVGEHSAEVRDAVCRDLGLGAPEVLVIEAQEEWQIALECFKLCQRASAK
jgi:acetate kinase